MGKGMGTLRKRKMRRTTGGANQEAVLAASPHHGYSAFDPANQIGKMLVRVGHDEELLLRECRSWPSSFHFQVLTSVLLLST